MNFLTIFTLTLLGAFSLQVNGQLQRFDRYYIPVWGSNHLSLNPQRTEVQLTMDQSSGAGFKSKYEFGSGVFHIKMKLPDKKTGGILTSFYLTTVPVGQKPGNHFEIDYEFLGTNGTVQTNIYDNDGGHREQSFNLWFDPTKDFHTYEFVWNKRQIVFVVDRIPIRVFKNNLASGVPYPTKPMHIEASIWDASWAGVVDWTQAPFVAQYTDFRIYACPVTNGGGLASCASSKFFWNGPNYLELTARQKKIMSYYRKLYMTYDYCSKPSTSKKECFL